MKNSDAAHRRSALAPGCLPDAASRATISLPRRQFILRVLPALLITAAAPPRIRAQTITPEKPRALDSATMQILLALAETINGVQPLRGHYARYYRHQVRHQPGYSAACRLLAGAVENAARRITGNGFVACDALARTDILSRLAPTSADEREFMERFCQETLAIFQKTDMWIQLGYRSWPGSARGLDEYRTPLPA
ncbi:hypothetical protein [Brenneria tiliae]|uniref:hypothetical protein n=1 Tax=Brenneria tiliae TaxID=2914984 RepID=UPI002014E1CF|nr:hypothetical protein [Brenneria tiliae]MCL2898433.1 hypothetical protein [Brenneria tiliae]MCL2903025.1 hypothetical protein [Brenneria tiliae]